MGSPGLPLHLLLHPPPIPPTTAPHGSSPLQKLLAQQEVNAAQMAHPILHTHTHTHTHTLTHTGTHRQPVHPYTPRSQSRRFFLLHPCVCRCVPGCVALPLCVCVASSVCAWVCNPAAVSQSISPSTLLHSISYLIYISLISFYYIIII